MGKDAICMEEFLQDKERFADLFNGSLFLGKKVILPEELLSASEKYAEQKKADWILNGGIDEEWDSYLKKMEKYGLSDYLSIKQKYFDQYQDSLSSEK